MATRKGANVFVVRSQKEPGKFTVKQAGNPTPLTPPTTQANAIAKAIPMAKANRGEVVIQGRDGKFRDSDSYGNDPNPPKDRKH